MWTAAADPHVLRVRVSAAPAGPGVDLSQFPYRLRSRDGCCHIRLDLPDGAMRLDLLEGAVPPGAAWIEPAVDLSRALDPQLASIRRLVALLRGDAPPPIDRRFLRLVEALRAADALAAGASLRDMALGVLGDDWPGDGEHLKSRARRRVRLAAELVNAGPLAVLGGRI